MFLRLLAECTHDPCVRIPHNNFLQYLMSWSTLQFPQLFRNPTSVKKFAQFFLLWWLYNFSIFFVMFVNIDHYVQEARWSWLATNEELDCPPTKFPNSIVRRVMFFTHFCDCPASAQWIDNFPPPWLLSWLENGLVARETGSTFFEWYHQLSAVPFTLRTIFTNRKPLFLWTKTKKCLLSCSKSSFKQRNKFCIAF